MTVRVVARLTIGGNWGFRDLLRVPVIGDVLKVENGKAFRVEHVCMTHVRPDRDLIRQPGPWVLVSELEESNRLSATARFHMR